MFKHQNLLSMINIDGKTSAIEALMIDITFLNQITNTQTSIENFVNATTTQGWTSSKITFGDFKLNLLFTSPMAVSPPSRIFGNYRFYTYSLTSVDWNTVGNTLDLQLSKNTPIDFLNCMVIYVQLIDAASNAITDANSANHFRTSKYIAYEIEDGGETIIDTSELTEDQRLQLENTNHRRLFGYRQFDSYRTQDLLNRYWRVPLCINISNSFTNNGKLFYNNAVRLKSEQYKVVLKCATTISANVTCKVTIVDYKSYEFDKFGDFVKIK